MSAAPRRSAPRWAVAVASFGGSGFAPRAPGTAGSLAALPLGWLLLRSPPLLLGAIALASLGGGVAVRRASGGADHGWIVIDEVAGMWITLTGLLGLPGVPAPRGARLGGGLAAAFLLFRLLDIAKPGPIGAIDRRHDALGVMGDDVAAGLVAAALLLAGRYGLERAA